MAQPETSGQAARGKRRNACVTIHGIQGRALELPGCWAQSWAHSSASHGGAAAASSRQASGESIAASADRPCNTHAETAPHACIIERRRLRTTLIIAC